MGPASLEMMEGLRSHSMIVYEVSSEILKPYKLAALYEVNKVP